MHEPDLVMELLTKMVEQAETPRFADVHYMIVGYKEEGRVWYGKSVFRASPSVHVKLGGMAFSWVSRRFGRRTVLKAAADFEKAEAEFQFDATPPPSAVVLMMGEKGEPWWKRMFKKRS